MIKLSNLNNIFNTKNYTYLINKATLMITEIVFKYFVDTLNSQNMHVFIISCLLKKR
jgi:hypothetical protein